MLSDLEAVADRTRRAKEAHLEAAAKPCKFCNKRISKYTCPRCTFGYCSVECYRSNQHLECLAATDGKSEEKKKMEEILRKYEFQAPEDGGALKFVGDPNTITEGERDDLDDVDEDDVADIEDEDEDDENENEEDEDEDEDEETVQRRKDLAMRMEGLNIEEADFEEIWERLDAREREEFVRLAQELEKEDHTNPLLED